MRQSLLLLAMSAAYAAAQNCPVPVVLPSQYTSLGVSFIYDHASDERQIDKEWLSLSKGDKEGLISIDGNRIIEPVYDETYFDWQGGMLAVSQANKWGFLDRSGKEAIAPAFGQVWDFHQEVIAVGTEEGRFNQVIDKNGNVLFELADGSIENIGEGLIAVKQNDKVGFMNFKGEMVIAPQYDWTFAFRQGRAVVSRLDANGVSREGVIDEQGREIVPLEYLSVVASQDGYFIVSDAERKTRLLNRDGERVFAEDYDFIIGNYDEAGEKFDAFVDGVTTVFKNDYSSAVDKEGKEILPLKYRHLELLDNGLMIASLDGKYGVLNRQGETVIALEYDSISYDKHGKVFIIRQTFPDEDSRKNNATLDYFGVLNQTGEVIIAAQYDWIASSLSGKAYIAMKGDKYLLLDNSGKVLSDDWDFIGEGSVGMFDVTKDRRYGYINESGEVIVKPQYDYVSSIGDNLALVGKGKRIQLLDIQSGCVMIDMAGSWKK